MAWCGERSGTKEARTGHERHQEGGMEAEGSLLPKLLQTHFNIHKETAQNSPQTFWTEMQRRKRDKRGSCLSGSESTGELNTDGKQ